MTLIREAVIHGYNYILCLAEWRDICYNGVILTWENLHDGLGFVGLKRYLH